MATCFIANVPAESIEFLKNGTINGINITWTKDPNGDTTPMEYKIDSPEITTLGYLEKDMTIKGCEGRGCRIVLAFGREVFYNKSLEEDYKNGKIKIDLAKIKKGEEYIFQEKKKTACQSFIIILRLEFPVNGTTQGKMKRKCMYEVKKEKFSRWEKRIEYGNTYNNDTCTLEIGAWEFNLLEKWLRTYKRNIKVTRGESKSIAVQMGKISDFSCDEKIFKQEMSLNITYTEENQYCKSAIDTNFLNNSSIIHLTNITDCSNRKKIKNYMLECLDREIDLSMSINLDLDKCVREGFVLIELKGFLVYISLITIFLVN